MIYLLRFQCTTTYYYTLLIIIRLTSSAVAETAEDALLPLLRHVARWIWFLQRRDFVRKKCHARRRGRYFSEKESLSTFHLGGFSQIRLLLSCDSRSRVSTHPGRLKIEEVRGTNKWSHSYCYYSDIDILVKVEHYISGYKAALVKRISRIIGSNLPLYQDFTTAYFL